MQYGNYDDLKVYRDEEGKFKSYYVVWKLKRVAYAPAASDTFKSYYVVWKRNVPGFVENTSVVFKSYYVVWKLFLLRTIVVFFSSLNRTMQYGNGVKMSPFASPATGLNRTMQYGNSHE